MYFHSVLGASRQYLNIIIDYPCANFLRQPESSFLLICKGQFSTYLTGLRKFSFLFFLSFLSLYGGGVVVVYLFVFCKQKVAVSCQGLRSRAGWGLGLFSCEHARKVCSVSSWNVLSRETFRWWDHSWMYESLFWYFQPQFMHITSETWNRFHGEQEILEVILLSPASQLRPT